MILVFILYALFAAVFTISKEALFYAAPFFLVGVRMVIAGLAILALFWFQKKEKATLSKKQWGKIALLALFNIFLTNTLEYWGLKYLTAFKTCFLYSLSPFLSAFFSYLFLSERMNGKKWLGLIVGFIGLIPILLSQTTLEEQAGKLFCFSWAEIAVLIAVCSSVAGWVILRDLVHYERVNSLVANGLSMILGGLFALGESALFEDWHPLPVSSFWPFLITSALLIIVSNGICYNLAAHILKRVSATFFSFAGLTTPLFTALFGYLAHGEVPSWAFWGSYLVILCGLFIFYHEEMQKSEKGAMVAS